MVTAPLIVADLRGAFVGPLSMIVEQGSCAAIAGPSGSGKSLLLRMIADLDPSDGEIHLGPMRRNATTAPHWRRMIMYVASEAGWWAPDARSHVPREATEPAARLCTRLGLGAEHLDRPISTLSTGERQRLALVRALVRRPKALLLDEPTSALDPASVALVESVLGDAIADGLILVVVSHDAKQARRLGTRRYAMQAGRLTEA